MLGKGKLKMRNISDNLVELISDILPGSILKRKDICVIFRKRAKYLKIWANMYKIWKYFEKGQSHVCDYCMHEATRISLDCYNIQLDYLKSKVTIQR